MRFLPRNDRGFSMSGKYVPFLQPHVFLYYVHEKGMYRRQISKKMCIPEAEFNRQTRDFTFPNGSEILRGEKRGEMGSSVMKKYHAEDFGHRPSLSYIALLKPWVSTAPVHSSVYGA